MACNSSTILKNDEVNDDDDDDEVNDDDDDDDEVNHTTHQNISVPIPILGPNTFIDPRSLFLRVTFTRNNT
jgi:hypothetical protein